MVTPMTDPYDRYQEDLLWGIDDEPNCDRVTRERHKAAVAAIGKPKAMTS